MPIVLRGSGIVSAIRRKRRRRLWRPPNLQMSTLLNQIVPIGIGKGGVYLRSSQAGPGLASLALPGDTNVPIIFEPTSQLTGGDGEVWVIATGGVNWGGCEVFISTSGSSYALVGSIPAGSRQGLTTAILPGGSDPDLVNTLSVDLTESQGQLISGVQADADTFITLCYVGGELVAYETAVLTALNKYDLTYLRRGIYGTTIASHPIGSPFARIDLSSSDFIFKFQYTTSMIGTTIHVKLTSFNTFGQQQQDISTVADYTYAITGAGFNPLSNPVIAGLGAGTNTDWGIVNQSLIASADFANIATPIGAIINLGGVP